MCYKGFILILRKLFFLEQVHQTKPGFVLITTFKNYMTLKDHHTKTGPLQQHRIRQAASVGQTQDMQKNWFENLRTASVSINCNTLFVLQLGALNVHIDVCTLKACS